MSLSTQRERGYVEVAKERERLPVKIYYELHGDGPEHVVLIMGNTPLTLNSLYSSNLRFKHFLFSLGESDEISCGNKEIYRLDF
jgi:hypothetical protein